jgi:hypothetical protein
MPASARDRIRGADINRKLDVLSVSTSHGFSSQKEEHMKKHGKSIIALVAMVALIVGLSGCAKEGPMEKAGKKVDKAVEDIKK